MITQREALEALVEGKTVETEDHSYKLNGDNLMFRYGDISSWKQLSWLSEAVGISESYTMTFSEAYLKMKDGAKVVRSGDCEMYYYIADLPQGIDVKKRIFFRPIDDSEPGRLAYINISALEDEWRVME